MPSTKKPHLATCSLAGCFGCHMSLLDLDERLLDVAALVEFDCSPINDLKELGPKPEKTVRIGLVEGACANEENVHVLEQFRAGCDVLVALGDCAVMGCVPAMRNAVPLSECLDEAYRNGVTVHNPAGRLPDDPELPRLLDRVRPCEEVVKIDLSLPGCPPPAGAIEEALKALLGGRPLALPYPLLKYD